MITPHLRAKRGARAAMVFGALAVMLLSQPVRGDEFDTVNFIAGSSLRYDTNIFRTPASSAQSETSTISYAGIRFDKPYGLQRFQLNATETFTRYNAFSFLDNNALDYRAAWLWAVTQHLTGTISADRTQSQIPFTLTGGNQRNVLTSNSRNFSFDGWISGAWHLIGGYGQSETATEQPLLSVPSYRNRRVEGGLRYVSAAGNSITAIQRSIVATVVNQPLDLVNLIDTDYRDTESELRLAWRLTGKSTIDARVVRKNRRNEHFSQRDFSGTGGELRYGWSPTGKLKFNFTATRDVLPYAAFGNSVENSTFREDNTLSVVAIWQATGKVAVQGTLLRTLSDYRGPVFAPTGVARSDEFRLAQLRADWFVLRAVSLNASLEHSRRTSNIAGIDFTDTLFTVGAALRF